MPFVSKQNHKKDRSKNLSTFLNKQTSLYLRITVVWTHLYILVGEIDPSFLGGQAKQQISIAEACKFGARSRHQGHQSRGGRGRLEILGETEEKPHWYGAWNRNRLTSAPSPAIKSMQGRSCGNYRFWAGTPDCETHSNCNYTVYFMAFN